MEIQQRDVFVEKKKLESKGSKCTQKNCDA